MRLENLIREIDDEMYKKIMDNRTVEEEDARRTAEEVGLAAIKYGDLSNQASKDYIFDVDRFTSFEGNTGPYILYTIVRIKSILKKYAENGGVLDGTIRPAENDAEKSLMLQVVKFNEVIDNVYKETAPHSCVHISMILRTTLISSIMRQRFLQKKTKRRRKAILHFLHLRKKCLRLASTFLALQLGKDVIRIMTENGLMDGTRTEKLFYNDAIFQNLLQWFWNVSHMRKRKDAMR